MDTGFGNVDILDDGLKQQSVFVVGSQKFARNQFRELQLKSKADPLLLLFRRYRRVGFLQISTSQ